jgi:hypothetical protein
MPYSALLKARPEVLSADGVDGIIDLANLTTGRKKALEKDAARFFALTYPTADVRRVVEELHRRFNSEQQTAGLFLFEGLKGTGKSHLLLLVYHLFNSPGEAAIWLSRYGLQCRLPQDAVVVINKFTDLPLASIWDFIYERLGLQRTGKTLVHPGQVEVEKAIGDKRLVLIFDELEQGISVIADPAIQAQNVAFLQMLSEWANRSSQITLLASIYSTAQEPGQTLKRVPNCRLQFAHFEDREKVVLHRLFENAEVVDRNAVTTVVDSYTNIWRRRAPVPEEYASRFRNSFPFTPDLTGILLQRVPARGGFQGVRGALGFMATMVRLTVQKTDLITPAHASLDDADIRTRLADLTADGDLIQRARTDASNLSGKYPLATNIAAATFLYTVSSPVGSKQTGCTVEELQRAVLSTDTDINDFTQALGALEKYGAHFHYREARYYFDPEEQPDAKVEYKSLFVDVDKARELLRKIWLQDVFRDDGSAVIFSDVERTRDALNTLPKDRLRFVLAPRSLSPAERHELFHGLELRNQVVLLEPKDTSFDLDRNPDLLKWAQRQIAARELALFAEDAERRDAYERIERQDKGACAKAIGRAGLLFVHWQAFAANAAADEVELETVSGNASREEVLKLLQMQLFPEQAFIDHLLGRREDIFNKSVRMIERDYQQVLSYPVPANNEAVIRAVKRMCSESKIGIQHSRENVCGRSPNLTSNELRDAIIVAPFSAPVEQPRLIPPVPTPGQIPVGPLPSPGPNEPGGALPPTAPVGPTQEWRDIRCLPKDSPGDLRIEIASRLADLTEPRVRQVTFKIFLQQVTGDLSSLPSSVRGGLKGPGAVTAEWQIVKDGDFSKAEVEAFAELLPTISSAKYDATMKVVVATQQATHV